MTLNEANRSILEEHLVTVGKVWRLSHNCCKEHIKLRHPMENILATTSSVFAKFMFLWVCCTWEDVVVACASIQLPPACQSGRPANMLQWGKNNTRSVLFYWCTSIQSFVSSHLSSYNTERRKWQPQKMCTSGCLVLWSWNGTGSLSVKKPRLPGPCSVIPYLCALTLSILLIQSSIPKCTQIVLSKVPPKMSVHSQNKYQRGV